MNMTKHEEIERENYAVCLDASARDNADTLSFDDDNLSIVKTKIKKIELEDNAVSLGVSSEGNAKLFFDYNVRFG